MLATAFLRAFWFLEKNNVILSDERSGHFYESEEVLGFEEGNAWVRLHPSAPRRAGRRGREAPAHASPRRGGKTLNAKLIEKLVEANVEKIPLRAESLVGRRTATRIVDTRARGARQTNTEINSQISRRSWAGGAPFKLLVIIQGKTTSRCTRRWRAITSKPERRSSRFTDGSGRAIAHRESPAPCPGMFMDRGATTWRVSGGS